MMIKLSTIILLILLITLGQGAFARYSGEMFLEADTIATLAQRSEDYLSFINDSSKLMNCRIKLVHLKTKEQQLLKNIGKLESQCFIETLSSNAIIKCLSLTYKTELAVKFLKGSMKRAANCHKEEAVQSKLESFTRVLETQRKEISKQYEAAILKDLRLKRKKARAENVEIKEELECMLDFSRDYKKALLYSSQSILLFHIGDLYQLKKSIKVVDALTMRMKSTSEVCENFDGKKKEKIEYLRLMNEKNGQNLNGLGFKEAQKKACRIFEKSNFTNPQTKVLCSKAVDTPSYRYALSKNLSELRGK